MNPFSWLRNYFIGDFLKRNSQNPFATAQIEVQFNFTLFFLLVQTPYLFLSFHRPLQFCMGLFVIISLIVVLVVLKRSGNVRKAAFFFLVNFFIQYFGHYALNNGRIETQASLFALLFISSTFLLLDRQWGFIVTGILVAALLIGIMNVNSGYSYFHTPDYMRDPPEQGNLRFLALIPLLLNVYLLSEFVKARQKAEKQITEQKAEVEEKQKEILDSIHYAKRIQNSLLPTDKYINRLISSSSEKEEKKE